MKIDPNGNIPPSTTMTLGSINLNNNNTANRSHINQPAKKEHNITVILQGRSNITNATNNITPNYC